MWAALVTGGSQGVGKGVVEGLAEAGQQVFFTGRDSGRIKETEEIAAALGGEVFGRRVDHAIDSQVETLFSEATSFSRCLIWYSRWLLLAEEKALVGVKFSNI